VVVEDVQVEINLNKTVSQKKRSTQRGAKQRDGRGV
jgi:hypothetical protein